MRKIVLITVFLAATMMPSLSSAIADGGLCNNSENASYSDCSGGSSSSVHSGPLTNSTTSDISYSGSDSRNSSSSASAKKYVPYDRIVALPDGNFCVTTGYREEGSSVVDGLDSAPGAHTGGNGFNNYYDLAPCPAASRAPTANEPTTIETAAMIAAQYWERIPLPTPRPRIAPGRAITGKLAYLETDGQLVHTYTNSTVVGNLEIVASGSYTVDWGDGTTTGPHSFEGKSWPDGQINHEYLTVGRYNVVVTENWTATWRLGGENGTLRRLQTTGRIDNFPVEQIQAVVGR